MKQRRFAGTQKKAVQKKQRNWFMRLEVHKAMELLWFQKKPLKAKLDKALQNKIISLKDTIGEAISKMRSDISRPKRKNALTLRTIEEEKKRQRARTHPDQIDYLTIQQYVLTVL